jgi:tetratricopeptide (TPR) repeat protein
MMKKIFACLLPVVVAGLLCACSQPAAPAKAAAKPDAAAGVDAQTLAMVASIRSAGNQFDSSVEVKPLRDAAVEGLLREAHEFEARQQIPQALDAVARALKIAPNAPDILQFEAELRIQAHDWQQAATLAQKSWELGPKVGALCARNLQTLAQVHETQGDTAKAAQARQRLSGCRVPEPARY